VFSQRRDPEKENQFVSLQLGGHVLDALVLHFAADSNAPHTASW
jgi:hypothetical protein